MKIKLLNDGAAVEVSDIDTVNITESEGNEL